MNKFSIIWSNRAFEDWLEIEDFINNKTYSDAIFDEIVEKTETLKKFPSIGKIQKKFLSYEFRYLIIRHYKILYTFRNEKIYIESIFDTRQDPEKMFE